MSEHKSGAVRFGNLPVAIVIVSALTLSACSTTGTGAGPLAFAATGSSASSVKSETLLGELRGGILPGGSIDKLSKTDRYRALEAEYKALESAPGGLPVEWKSFDGKASGQVIAATPYQVGRQNCRQYTHIASIGGASVTGQGAACRNEDGSWTPLT